MKVDALVLTFSGIKLSNGMQSVIFLKSSSELTSGNEKLIGSCQFIQQASHSYIQEKIK